ncbi:MAG: sodium:alanine symporter family protein [Deferrisomatales bacterium]
MDALAKWIWDPLLCLVYLEVGVVFVLATGAVAWRRSFRAGWHVLRTDRSPQGDRVVPHTKAFFSTIGATVGIGNLAGVGTAIHLGGPGALFWMCVSAAFGMSFRMAATFFAVKYRPTDSRALNFATPMVYLEKYMRGVWSFVPPLVAGLTLVQGVVLSNLVQSNSLSHALHNRFHVPPAVTAVLLTSLVAVVILGGLSRIVDYSNAIAPWMILTYATVGVVVLAGAPARTVRALGEVTVHAFRPYSMAGGMAGYAVFQAMQFGVSRGIFSHMSGLGTGTFLQGANEDSPATGAFMSALTPFVDTLVICTITGLVILSAPYWQSLTGAHLAADSFEYAMGLPGQVVVLGGLAVFGFTTIAAFAHVAERCYRYLGGTNVLGYRLGFLAMTFLGPFLDLGFVWSLSDIIIAALIVFHLLPLLCITLRNLPEMMADLRSHGEAGRPGLPSPAPPPGVRAD